MNHDDFQCYMSTLYQLLMAAVRSNDRSLMLQYVDDIAIRRFAEGFEPGELCNTLSAFKKIIIAELISIKDLYNIKQDIYDYIGLTIQLAQEIIPLYAKGNIALRTIIVNRMMATPQLLTRECSLSKSQKIGWARTVNQP